MIVTALSVKGSPGVTTAVTMLGALWPPGAQVLVVEADPAGGDLAARFEVTPVEGMAALCAAARHGLSTDVVEAHVEQLPGGLRVIFGASGRQAGAVASLWPSLAPVLAEVGGTVLVDAGRVSPGISGGIRALLARSEVTLVFSSPVLPAMVHLRDLLPELAAATSQGRLLVVPTGGRGFPPADIAAALEVEVAEPMPIDRAGAALAAGIGGRRGRRSPLRRWAEGLSRALVTTGDRIVPGPEAGLVRDPEAGPAPVSHPRSATAGMEPS